MLAAHADEPASVFVWEREESYFGGLSGFEIGADGTSFVAIGDSATVLKGEVVRDAEGRIVDMALDGPIGGLTDAEGRPLWQVGDGDLMDSEGLARLPDGRWAVSFEAAHRVWLYDDLGDGPADPLPDAPFFGELQYNSGIETLAADELGRLWAIPERSGARERPFPVHRYADGAWSTPLSLPRRGRFLPTGADFDDEGRLYLLERDFLGLLGFRTRVRRFTFDGDAIRREETLLVTGPAERDNLEGIGVWRGADGALRMTLISDDNHFPLQRTEVVEYRLTE